MWLYSGTRDSLCPTAAAMQPSAAHAAAVRTESSRSQSRTTARQWRGGDAGSHVSTALLIGTVPAADGRTAW